MTPKVRKLLRRSLLAGCVLAALLAVAPWGFTALFGRSILEGQLRKRLLCDVKVEGLSGGWSGVKLDSLTLSQPPGFEATGTPLLELTGVSVKLVSYWGALLGAPDGEVTVDFARGVVVRGEDGLTNLQRAIRPRDPSELESAPSSGRGGGGGSARSWGLTAELKRGTLVLRDVVTPAEATIDRVTATARRAAGAPELTYGLQCDVAAARGAGALSIRGSYRIPTNEHEIQLDAEKLDLGAFTPLFASAKWVSTVEGLVQSKLRIRTGRNGAFSGDGALTISNLHLAGGRLAAPIREPLIRVTPNFTYDPKSAAVSVEGLEWTSSALHVKGKGSFQRGAGGNVDLDLNADLTKAQETMAAFFPENARVSGLLTGKVKLTQAPGGGSDLLVAVDARGVSAAPNGAPAASTDGTLHLTGTVAPDLRSAELQRGTLAFGPVAVLDFSGTWRRVVGAPGPGEIDAKLTGDLSLDQLGSRLGGLFPERLALAGAVKGEGSVRTSEAQEIRWSASAAATGVHVGVKPGLAPREGEPAWLTILAANPIREERVFVGGEGSRDPRFERFEIANLVVNTSSGALDATASAEGSWRSLASTLEASVHARGDLGKLSAYAAAWLPPRLRCGGAVNADLELKAENGRVRGPVKIVVKHFEASAGPAPLGARGALDDAFDRLADRPVKLDEWAIAGNVEMDPQQQTAVVPDLRLATSPRALEAGGVLRFHLTSTPDRPSAVEWDGRAVADVAGCAAAFHAFADGGAEAAGECAVAAKVKFERDVKGGRAVAFDGSAAVGDLARLARAFTGRELDVSGKLAARGAFSMDGATLLRKFSLDASVDDVATGSQPPDTVTLTAVGQYYFPDKGIVAEIESAELRSRDGHVKLEASGKGGFRAGIPFAEGRGSASLDAEWLSRWLPASAARWAGTVHASFDARPDNNLTRIAFEATGSELRRAESGPAPPLDVVLKGEAAMTAGKLAIEPVTLEASPYGIRVKGEGVTVARENGLRALSGNLTCELDGARLAEALQPFAESRLRISDGTARVKLGGWLGGSPLETVTLDGTASLPRVEVGSTAVTDATAAFSLVKGRFSIEPAAAKAGLAAGGAPEGTLALSAMADLTTRPRSFTAHVKADGVPAAKELSVPLSRVFPLFGGNFRFAKVDGAVSADVDATGNLGDWKSSLTGEARTTFSNVHFSREGDFGQLAALLRLEGLGSKVRTIDVDSSIGDGRVAIRQVLVDGDPARLPVKGSVGFDGAVDVRVELSKAKLGKRLEPYRPIVGLFEPEFTGAVKSPTFGVRVPTAQKLAQESAKLAARSVLGGEKLDLAKLAGARSLGDFAALDDDETLDTRPDLDGSGAGKPAVTDANAAVPKSDGTGSLPAELNAPFRALTRGKTRFDYAALGRDKALTERLRAWLEAAPVAPRSDDASLADALNRYEVALALAVAKELENPLFRITSGKRGVHGIDGFFDRPVAVSGLTTTLAELALRIRTMGGVAAAGCIPGAAEDLPWIDRAGVDASTVRRSMDERAAAYVAASKWNAKTTALAVPQSLHRYFKNDDVKLRAFLEKYLDAGHPARPHLAAAKLGKLAESLEVDAP